MRHLGILAHSTEGAALCFLAFCQEGFRELGVHQHPDVTMDCIAMGRSMPAWEAGEHQSIRATLAESAERLARAGADFFVCPDNTAHMALEQPGDPLALPGQGHHQAVGFLLVWLRIRAGISYCWQRARRPLPSMRFSGFPPANGSCRGRNRRW